MDMIVGIVKILANFGVQILLGRQVLYFLVVAKSELARVREGK